jgi:hypothetical protein
VAGPTATRGHGAPRSATAKWGIRWGIERAGNDPLLDSIARRPIIFSPGNIEAYRDGVPRFGATCWRVTGPSLDEIATAIGVEIYVDHLGKRLVVVTVF